MFDIHDRVNYAVTATKVECKPEEKLIILHLNLDEEICTLYDYFDIFLTRMTMCSKAARKFDSEFSLRINGQKVL